MSGLVFDEIHAQPNRKLYDVLTKGSGDAREQPLFFIITTAGNDKNSICYELHTKALDLMAGRKKDSTFYPVVYGLEHEEDWTDEANWYKANPSLGHTIQIDRVREAYRNAVENPAEENVFKQLRLNIWTSASIRWIPEQVYDKGNLPIDLDSLRGRMCYGGLDLSSTSDITALVLAFPPRSDDEKYILLPFFWLPEDTLELRCRRDHVLYDIWQKQGFIQTTEGNVIHYGFIEKFIERLGETYHIREIAYDRWNATQMVQNLEDMGFTMVPFGQGTSSMVEIPSSNGWPAPSSCAKTLRGTSSRTKKNPSKRSTESWRPSWHWIGPSVIEWAGTVFMTNGGLLHFRVVSLVIKP